MTPQEAYNLGVPLNEALEKYGNWRKFNSANYSLPCPMPKDLEDNAGALPDLIKNLSDVLIEPGRQRHAISEDFKNQLEAKELIGIGYLSPRNISDTPQLIPADIWKLGKVDYSKSEIKSGSLRFESIRIIQPHKNNELSSSNDNRELRIDPPNPVGRPSSRDKIIEAYEQLKSEGAINYSKPMTHAYPVIQERLFEKHKTITGYRNEAIRIAIHDDFLANAKI